MNEIVNKFLLNGDKIMLELHLRQSRVTCSTRGPFTKHRKKIQKFKERRNELDKMVFAHDAAYVNFKELAKRAVSGKVLKDRIYEIALNPKYNGH